MGQVMARVLAREHRATLADSMATAKEVDSFESLLARIRLTFPDTEADRVRIEDYGYDARIGWHTYLVSINGLGVWGMTSGPLPREKEKECQGCT